MATKNITVENINSAINKYNKEIADHEKEINLLEKELKRITHEIELKIGQHRNEIAQSKCFRKIYENALVDLERENQ